MSIESINKIDNQAKLKVKLIAYTPNPDKVVATAAKLCYSSTDIETLQDSLTDDKVEKFLNMLMNINHQSPIEHVSFTFAVEGISRALTHQLVRHRIASYSQKSQRYVREGQFQYIIPKEIENNKDAKELYIYSMEDIQDTYDRIVALLLTQYADEYLKQNNIVIDDKEYSIDNFKVSKFQELNKKEYNKAEKKAIENARYILPNACETKIIITMNARTLLHYFNERCCVRTQDEHREMAFAMLKEVKQVAPLIFKNAGAKCVKNKICPEGNMSCGMFPTK